MTTLATRWAEQARKRKRNTSPTKPPFTFTHQANLTLGFNEQRQVAIDRVWSRYKEAVAIYGRPVEITLRTAGGRFVYGKSG